MPIEWIISCIIGFLLSRSRPRGWTLFIMCLVFGLGLALSIPKVTAPYYACGANMIAFAVGVGIGQWVKAHSTEKPKQMGFVSMAHPKR